MSEEVKTNAMELSDEDMEKVAGGQNGSLHTCIIYEEIIACQDIRYKNRLKKFCRCGCPYSQSSDGHPSQCSNGQTTVSFKDVQAAHDYWIMMGR
jgi:hypothetical protein